MTEPRVALLHLAFPEYTACLANALHDEVDLTVVHPEQLAPSMSSLLSADVAVRTFDKPRFRNPKNVLRMPSLMRMLSEFDVIHVQQTGDPWVDVSLGFTLAPRTVVTIHDVSPHSGDGDRIPGSFAARSLLHRRAGRLIVHTEGMAGELESMGYGARSAVIPHILTRSAWGADISGPSDPPTNRQDVLFFGRIWEYKGLDLLVAAMRRVVARLPDARLVVAGRGDDVAAIVPDEPWVEVHNRFIPTAEVAELFQRSAVVALPYRDATQSGVGVQCVDFLRPAVAAPVGGLPELFRNDEGAASGALFADPKDPAALAEAIVSLLEDDELYSRTQDGLRSVAHRLAPGRVAAQTAAAYRAVQAAGQPT